jgi:hypothetical protein
VINGLVENRTESEMSNRVREMIDGMIEIIAKREVSGVGG